MRQRIISGVYIITNIKNNKHYIGESNNVRKRLLSHKNDLLNNRHNNIHLQRAFNIDGIDNFMFELLDECIVDNCHAMEHYWCNILRVHNDNFGYNLRLTTTENKVGKHSDESKRKLSLAHTGKKISDTHRLAMSKAQLSRDNTGGQYRSPEAKAKIALVNISRQKSVLQFSKDGVFVKEWDSRMSAAKELNIGYSAICNNTLNYSPTAGNFIWKLK